MLIPWFALGAGSELALWPVPLHLSVEQCLGQPEPQCHVNPPRQKNANRVDPPQARTLMLGFAFLHQPSIK
jgi:hypothetical protein